MISKVNIESPWMAPFDGSYSGEQLDSAHLASAGGARPGKLLKKSSAELADLARTLYAGRHNAVLFLFQALDAAGKDGTIRRVFSGIDPHSIHAASFKAPTELERRHDMFWRTNQHLPPRGCISLFNRSYYEEVLVVKVHPQFLGGQYPGGIPDTRKLWQARYQAIREHEKHLATSGTLVIKFWLQVSAEEQRKRFLSRLDEPHKHWKFNAGDVREAGFRDQYMDAVVEMVNETSRPCAPWFIIPADDKNRMRAEVASIAAQALRDLDPKYPEPDSEMMAQLDAHRELLKKD
jgi:PPK2 family polyphosphate:nucleotide phosphotransferase